MASRRAEQQKNVLVQSFERKNIAYIEIQRQEERIISYLKRRVYINGCFSPWQSQDIDVRHFKKPEYNPPVLLVVPCLILRKLSRLYMALYNLLCFESKLVQQYGVWRASNMLYGDTDNQFSEKHESLGREYILNLNGLRKIVERLGAKHRTFRLFEFDSDLVALIMEVYCFTEGLGREANEPIHYPIGH